jgi:dolichyl-phosphate-mannose-protein mannosyltransferase
MSALSTNDKSAFGQESENKPWFWLGIGGLWIFSLVLRFWGLGRFNTLVFDEVYFARYGNNYLAGQAFFDSHPPLGKFMIALGIWLANGFNPIGYRWMNALVGSLIPLLIVAIAYQLSKRRGFALIAGLLTATDGLLLVESRYALINVHLMFWGLLGQWLFLLALQAQRIRWLGMIVAAICLGAAVAVKWNSMGFVLGLYGVWLAGIFIYWCLPACRELLDLPVVLPLQFLRRLHPVHLMLTLPVTMVGVYLLVWVPHHAQNTDMNFWQLQQEMYGYHKRIGSGPETHAYCSRWSSWPWMVRPVSYFFQRVRTLNEPVPVTGPTLPDSSTTLIYDVHAMGNPFLWWLSSLAIIAMAVMLFWHLWRWFGRLDRGFGNDLMPVLFNPVAFWLPLFLVGNYATNLLPWVSVTRCLFIYHYMPASVYSFMALAWFVHAGLVSRELWIRWVSLTVVFLILAGFVFWMPIYLGLPLTWDQFRFRMWFPSWV